MTDETPENECTTNSGLQDSIERILIRLDRIENAQHEHTQTLRTVMVGWNAFLKSAESQLRAVFKGNIPQPILKKLIQGAFKGMDEAERRGNAAS